MERRYLTGLATLYTCELGISVKEPGICGKVLHQFFPEGKAWQDENDDNITGRRVSWVIRTYGFTQKQATEAMDICRRQRRNN